LRLYAYYKRSRRHPSTNRMADHLAPIIQRELQLLMRRDGAIRLLAVVMWHQIGAKQYTEDYFVELASWITRLHMGRAH
jgi:hypothetical protein